MKLLKLFEQKYFDNFLLKTKSPSITLILIPDFQHSNKVETEIKI